MRLEDAVRAWIVAEWKFRLGPHAYSARAQDWLVKAEENLRTVLTGHPGLPQAARALGKGGLPRRSPPQ